MKNSPLYITAGIVYLINISIIFFTTFSDFIDLSPNFYKVLGFIEIGSYSLLFFSLTVIIKLFNERKAVAYALYIYIAACIAHYAYDYYVKVPGPYIGTFVISCISIFSTIFFLIQSFLIKAKPIAIYFRIIPCLLIVAGLFRVILPFLGIDNFVIVDARANILMNALAPITILMIVIKVARPREEFLDHNSYNIGRKYDQ